MRREYLHFSAELFPTAEPNIYWGFVAAPFWSDIDLRLEGQVSWDIYTEQSPEMLTMVTSFIRENANATFNGTWMMVAFWEDVHPFPHGAGSTTPFAQSVCRACVHTGICIHFTSHELCVLCRPIAFRQF